MAYLFCFVAIVQLVFWGYFLRRAYTNLLPEHTTAGPEDRVSVIVCFRNEEDKLTPCIEGILQQRFPGDFELLLVDDNSTDNSAALVRPYAERHEHVHLLHPGATRPGKKDALTYGIANARHDHLLLTDADCVPASSRWLLLMTEPLRLGAELVLGVSPLLPQREHSLLAYWQWFESTYVSLKYLGFASRKLPYMGVGRNLAYSKTFFERAGGFAAHAELAGGDDDLLVSANAHAGHTARVTDPAAWTMAQGQPDWKAYFRQRNRHQSTGIHYPRMTGILLGGLALSHGLFYLLGCYLLFTSWWWLAAGCYGLRFAFLLVAYARPLLNKIPASLRNTSSDKRSWRWLATTVLWGDALVGPMYLFLAISSLRPRRAW